MNGLFFRRLALGAAFALGIGSILATSPPPPSIYFEETNIRPSWRCPGADVTFDWSLNEPAPVLVTVDDREYRVEAETKSLTVDADIFDRTDSPIEAALRIGTNDIYYRDKYEIRTLRNESWVDQWAYHTENAGFAMNQGTGLWDRGIDLRGFEITDVRNFVCEGESKLPQSWEVTAPSGQTFGLRAGAGIERRLDTGIPAGGIWKLRPRGADCRAAPSGLQPVINIRLTAVCRKSDKSS